MDQAGGVDCVETLGDLHGDDDRPRPGEPLRTLLLEDLSQRPSGDSGAGEAERAGEGTDAGEDELAAGPSDTPRVTDGPSHIIVAGRDGVAACAAGTRARTARTSSMLFGREAGATESIRSMSEVSSGLSSGSSAASEGLEPVSFALTISCRLPTNGGRPVRSS